ncbi:hypothetical protein ACA910_010028 [Epithemia clementina (nom. ined.)]
MTSPPPPPGAVADEENKDPVATANDSKTADNSKNKNGEWQLVYRSHFYDAMWRLRRVSLFSGCAGAFGLPVALIWSNKSQFSDPTSVGFWALWASFGLASFSTTLFLAHVFGPYVIEMYRRPTTTTTTTTATSLSPIPKPRFLYKATTISFFLWKREHVFDPETELFPYSSVLNPLSNLVIIPKEEEEDDKSDDEATTTKTNNNSDSNNDQKKKKKRSIVLFIHPDLVQYDPLVAPKFAAPASSSTSSSSSVPTTAPAKSAPSSGANTKRQPWEAPSNPDHELRSNKKEAATITASSAATPSSSSSTQPPPR